MRIQWKRFISVFLASLMFVVTVGVRPMIFVAFAEDANLCLGKTVTATVGGTSAQPNTNLTDGTTAKRYCSKGSIDWAENSIIVDLENSYSLGKIVVTLYASSANTLNADDYKIETGVTEDSEISWTTVQYKTPVVQEAAAGSYPVYTTELNPAVEAEQIRVTFYRNASSKAQVHIAEIEAYAAAQEPNEPEEPIEPEEPMDDASVSYVGTLSDSVRHFSLEDLSAYVTSATFSGGNATANNVNISNYPGTQNKALKLYNMNASGAAYGAAVTLWEGTQKESDLRIKFKLNLNGYASGNFDLLAESGSYLYPVLRIESKQLKIFGTQLTTITLGDWYDFELNLDLDDGYANVRYKKSTEAVWAETDILTSNVYKQAKMGTTNNILPFAATSKIAMQIYGRNVSEATTAYIDDLVIDKNDVKTKGMWSHGSNTESLNLINTTTAPLVSSHEGWLTEGINGSSEISVQRNTDGENKIVFSANSAANPGIYKMPFYSAPDVTHRIRFKMSGASASGSANCLTVGFNLPKDTTENTSENDATGIFWERLGNFDLLKIKENELVLGDSSFEVNLNKNCLYDCELIYDAGAKIAMLALIDEEGRQYVGSASGLINAAVGEGNSWGLLSKLNFHMSADDNGGVMHLKDINWTLLDDTVSGIASIQNDMNDAYLDEMIYFDFSETLNSAACTGTSTVVTIKENGEIIETDYKLVCVGERLTVELLENLSKNTEYEISVEGVKTLSGKTVTEPLSITFKTSMDAVDILSQPRIQNNLISATVKSNCRKGVPVTLLVRLEDSEGAMSGAIATTQNVNYESDTLTIDLSGVEYTKAVPFIWSDIFSQIPYGQWGDKQILTVENETGAVIESVVLNNGDLSITGKFPEIADEWVTVGILASDTVYWTQDQIPSEQLATAKSLDRYNADTDEITDYLAWFGQINNKAGQSFGITIPNYTGPSNPEIRMLTGKGNFVYWSPSVLSAINSATTWEEFKNAFYKNDFLVNAAAQELENEIVQQEESVFWGEYLKYKNSLDGGFPDLNSIAEFAEMCLKLTILYTADSRADIEAMLKTGNDTGAFAYNTYDIYIGAGAFKVDGMPVMSDEQKDNMAAYILSKISDYASLEEFVQDIEAQAVLYACNNSKAKALVKAVLEEAEILDGKLEKYLKLSNSDRLNVCKTISNTSVFLSIDKLCEAVEAASKGGGGGNSGTDGDSPKNDKPAATISTSSQTNEKQNPKYEFKDLDTVEWAKEAIYALRDKGIVSGRDEDTFDPLSIVTREEFAKLLVLAKGCYVTNYQTNFKDVGFGSWYYDYVGSAQAAGLINGVGDGTFGVGNAILRQDMAVLISRAMGHTDSENMETHFIDNSEIANYAKSAISFVQRQGLMSGVGGNRFDPLGEVTRAQAAKVIYELIKRG